MESVISAEQRQLTHIEEVRSFKRALANSIAQGELGSSVDFGNNQSRGIVGINVNMLAAEVNGWDLPR